MANGTLTAADVAKMADDMRRHTSGIDVAAVSDEMQRNMAASLLRGVGLGGVTAMLGKPGPVSNAQIPVTGSRPRTFGSQELEQMLRMRMRSARESYFPHWHCYKHGDEKVFVMVVTSDGNSVTLVDEWPLFPSDALITKLRLLEK